jgi:tetratricopeptide (TPR) repeat protein
MKAPFLTIFLFVFPPLHAQDKIEKEQEKLELPGNQKAFLNLPGERRNEFAQHILKAVRLLDQKRIFETIDEVEKAAKIFNESAEIHNIRGSCYLEIEAFDKALVEYKKGAALSPNNPSIEFNIAEVMFMTKQWQQSHDHFSANLKNIPDANIELRRLTEFKILLCKLKLGQKDEARILAEKYDFLGDSPYYYYAQIAIAYDDGDQAKADEWLGIHSRIFPARSSFPEALIGPNGSFAPPLLPALRSAPRAGAGDSQQKQHTGN